MESIKERPGDIRYEGKYISPASNILPPGTELQFESILATISVSSETSLPLDAFDGAVLSLHFTVGNVHTIEGSAVMVGPGIAIAASHVIEPHKDSILAGDRTWLVTGVSHSGILNWQPRIVSQMDGTDLTLLAMDFASPLPRENRFRHVGLTTRTPAVGEKIAIIGTRPRQANYVPNSNKRLRVDSDLLLRCGEVSDVHPISRNKVLTPYPMFEVRCETAGGMSGGPAFDGTGRLIGILSTGMNSSDGGGPSNVSLVHQALGYRFKRAWLTDVVGIEGSLLDLPYPLVDIEKREAVSVRYLDGGKYETTYDQWFER